MNVPGMYTPAFAGVTFDSAESICMFSWWYYPAAGSIPPGGDQRYRDKFKWANPTSWADGRAGRFCSKSHAWFPGGLVREVEDETFGAPFAPRERGGC